MFLLNRLTISNGCKIRYELDVVNISSDKPLHKDIFFVDTNVWYWYAYTGTCITAAHYQVKEYPEYVKKIKSVNV